MYFVASIGSFPPETYFHIPTSKIQNPEDLRSINNVPIVPRSPSRSLWRQARSQTSTISTSFWFTCAFILCQGKACSQKHSTKKTDTPTSGTAPPRSTCSLLGSPVGRQPILPASEGDTPRVPMASSSFHQKFGGLLSEDQAHTLHRTLHVPKKL